MMKRRKVRTQLPEKYVDEGCFLLNPKEMVMNGDGHDKVSAFDTLFTNSHIQMLKILMPYFDHSLHKNLAIYIKYLELQYTISFLNKYPYASVGKEEITPKNPDLFQILGELSPFLPPKEREKLEGMQNLFQTFENYKNMMEMVQSMKEIFPDGDGSGLDFMSSLGAMGGSGEATDQDQMNQMAQMMQMMQLMQGASENVQADPAPSGREEQDESQNQSSGMDE
jgi:hypothetical protein